MILLCAQLLLLYFLSVLDGLVVGGKLVLVFSICFRWVGGTGKLVLVFSI